VKTFKQFILEADIENSPNYDSRKAAIQMTKTGYAKAKASGNNEVADAIGAEAHLLKYPEHTNYRPKSPMSQDVPRIKQMQKQSQERQGL
jgi:hypothetical protein